MVVSNGTNPFCLHHFPLCSNILHSFFVLSISPILPPKILLILCSILLAYICPIIHHSVFPGNCFMALLVAVGKVPQIYGCVKGLSPSLRPKTLLSPILTLLNIRFSFTSSLSLSQSQTLITLMDLSQWGSLYKEVNSETCLLNSGPLLFILLHHRLLDFIYF